MTIVMACDYEGTGPAGTTLTNGNTGGVVTIGASATAVSTASAAQGAFAGSFAVPATNVSSRVQSTASGGLGFAISFKFRVPTGFATTKLMASALTAGSARIVNFNYNGTTDRVNVQTGAGAGTLTLPFTLTLNTWYRVEAVCLVDTSVTGQVAVNIYDNEGTTPLVAGVSSTTYDLGTTAMGLIQHGIIGNGTTVIGAIDIDSVRFEAGGTTELGPEAKFGDVSGSVTNTGTVSGSVGKIGNVSGATTATGTVSGSVGKLGNVTGATTATGTVVGRVGRVGATSGAITVGGTVAGSVGKVASVSGATTCGGTVIGLVTTGFEVTNAYAVSGSQSAVPSAFSGTGSAPTSTGG